MRDVSLPLARLFELSVVVDSIPLKELGTAKDVRLVNNLVKDIRESCKGYADLQEALFSKQAECAKKYQEEYAAKQEALDEEGRKVLSADLDRHLNIEIKEKFGAEREALEEEGKVELKVELGDEKFSKLKEVFEKYGVEKYLNKEVYIQVADAFGIE